MKSNFSDSRSIECQINSIFRLLQQQKEKNTVVKREAPGKGGACKGIISIYPAEEIQRQKEDRYYRPKALLRYAFYPSTYFPGRLGSIAVYGDNVMRRHSRVRRGAFLFGHRVAGARMQMGVRPFLDVTLAS